MPAPSSFIDSNTIKGGSASAYAGGRSQNDASLRPLAGAQSSSLRQRAGAGDGVGQAISELFTPLGVSPGSAVRAREWLGSLQPEQVREHAAAFVAACQMRDRPGAAANHALREGYACTVATDHLRGQAPAIHNRISEGERAWRLAHVDKDKGNT